MSTPPPVTVLLANWNGARFLDETIASVVAQTFPFWELLAVDTGSDDGSTDILKRWAARDTRIKPLLIDERMSCPRALNLGIEQTRSPFIARIESDDLWEPRRLEEQMAYFARPESARVGICGSAVTLIGEAGEVLGVKPYPETHAACLETIWYRTPFCHSSVLVRREVFAECGGYSDEYVLCEDLEMWFRAARRWELHNLPEPLARYRVWQGSLTTKRLAKLAVRSWQIRMRRAPALGYRVPPLALGYSFLALGAAALPPLVARKLFEMTVGRLGSRKRAGEEARSGGDKGGGQSGNSDGNSDGNEGGGEVQRGSAQRGQGSSKTSSSS